MKRYQQLNLEQRYQIEALLKAGIKKVEIAKQLNIHRCTLYREIKRNQAKTGLYRAKHANLLYDEKKERFKYNRKLTDAMKELIIPKLSSEQWSPEQIKRWCDLYKILYGIT